MEGPATLETHNILWYFKIANGIVTSYMLRFPDDLPLTRAREVIIL